MAERVEVAEPLRQGLLALAAGERRSARRDTAAAAGDDVRQRPLLAVSAATVGATGAANPSAAGAGHLRQPDDQP